MIDSKPHHYCSRECREAHLSYQARMSLYKAIPVVWRGGRKKIVSDNGDTLDLHDARPE
jgi:hypothetical protein